MFERSEENPVEVTTLTKPCTLVRGSFLDKLSSARTCKDWTEKELQSRMAFQGFVFATLGSKDVRSKSCGGYLRMKSSPQAGFII